MIENYQNFSQGLFSKFAAGLIWLYQQSYGPVVIVIVGVVVLVGLYIGLSITESHDRQRMYGRHESYGRRGPSQYGDWPD